MQVSSFKSVDFHSSYNVYTVHTHTHNVLRHQILIPEKLKYNEAQETLWYHSRKYLVAEHDESKSIRGKALFHNNFQNHLYL